MFKTNGRLSLQCSGVVDNIRIEKDGTATVFIDNVAYNVNSSKLLRECATLLGKHVTVEGYHSKGLNFISSISK